MKHFNLLAVLSVLFLSLWQPAPVISQGEAVYNLASIQPDKHIEIEAGGHGTGLIYFYNVDGNRATHIKLEVSSSQENWQLEIQPSPQQTVIDTASGSISLIENLCVEPSALQSDTKQSLPVGMEWVAVPNRGYATAKVVCLTVWVPESAKAGCRDEIVVTAEATWLGQQGAASIRQTRDFVFSVELFPADAGVTGEGDEGESEAIFPVEKWSLITTAGLAFLLIIGLLAIAKSTKHD